MELECSSITRLILPAVRASVAEEMNKKYKFNQQHIADTLGIAQVAVSKYLNGRYSKSVGKVKRYIVENDLDRNIMKYAKDSNSQKVNRAINELCAKLANTNLVL